MKISRRSAMQLGAFAGMLSLTACPGTTVPTVQNDVALVTTNLQGVLTALRALPSGVVSAATLASITSEVAAISADGANIASALAPTPTVMQTFSNAVAALVPLVTPFFPMAPIVAVVIQAVTTLVASMVTAVNGAPAAAVLFGTHMTMPVPTARDILNQHLLGA